MFEDAEGTQKDADERQIPKIDKLYTVAFQLETPEGAGIPMAKQWFHMKELVDQLNEQLPPGISLGILALAGGHLAVIPSDGKVDPRTASDLLNWLDRTVVQEALEEAQ